MELTVQEIIAKVAVKREALLKQQHQRDILQQIHNLKNKPQNFIKNQKNTKLHITSTSLQPISKSNKINHEVNNSSHSQINAQSILVQKYKGLQTAYKKLKRKVENQVKIDQTYLQLKQKLQKILKKNKKVQKQLDSIRTKKSVFEESKCQQNHKRSSNFNQHSVSYQKQSKTKQVSKKQKNISKFHQIDISTVKSQESIGKQNLSRGKTSKNEHKQIQCKSFYPDYQNEETSRFSHEHHQKASISWCQNEIAQYKLMISEKQSSVMKLKSMVEKQEQLITNYEDPPLVKGHIQNMKKVKINQGQKCVKIQGTIVKVKKIKQDLQLNRNQELTDRNMVYRNKNYHDINQSEKRTKKKIESEISQKYQNQQKLQDYQYESSYEPYFQQEQQGEMNQTSEFICDI